MTILSKIPSRLSAIARLKAALIGSRTCARSDRKATISSTVTVKEPVTSVPGPGDDKDTELVDIAMVAETPAVL